VCGPPPLRGGCPRPRLHLRQGPPPGQLAYESTLHPSFVSVTPMIPLLAFCLLSHPGFSCPILLILPCICVKGHLQVQLACESTSCPFNICRRNANDTLSGILFALTLRLFLPCSTQISLHPCQGPDPIQPIITSPPPPPPPGRP